MSPLIMLLILAVIAYALVTVGATGVKELPCPRGDCVPRAALLKSQKRSYHRLLGWRKAERERNRLRARWRPTVQYALTLASLVYGVPRWQLERVAWCESRFDPFAVNGKYRGIFQLGWSPFGLSPFDPFANALSAAQTVRHDGSWRQWECKP